MRLRKFSNRTLETGNYSKCFDHEKEKLKQSIRFFYILRNFIMASIQLNNKEFFYITINTFSAKYRSGDF